MKIKLKKWHKKLITLLVIFSLIFCGIIELGERFPGLGIPSWDELFIASDLAPPTTSPEGTIEIHVLDVGNADCILVRQGETTMLIDAGEKGDSDEILEYFRYHGIKKLDVIVATHAHADHVGSMAKIIRTLPVGQMVLAYMPEKHTPTSATYISMLEALDEHEVPVVEAEPGLGFTLGSAYVQVLAPIEEDADANAMSVVTYLTFGEKHFLFMGDAEKDVEKQILKAGYPIKADAIKVGHHGSKTASTVDFLRRVDPDYAIVTCGEKNSYGHPHPEALGRLANQDVEIYRSDLHGNLLFTSDGETITVLDEEQQKRQE